MLVVEGEEEGELDLERIFFALLPTNSLRSFEINSFTIRPYRNYYLKNESLVLLFQSKCKDVMADERIQY